MCDTGTDSGSNARTKGTRTEGVSTAHPSYLDEV